MLHYVTLSHCQIAHKERENIMKTGKKILGVIVAIVLIIALSAGTAIVVDKSGTISTNTTVKDGLSAYEIAVSEGYSGSLQNWLDSLNGKSAYDIAREAGFNGTEAEYGKMLNNLSESEAVTLKTASFNKDGQLILTLSDDTTINAGKAVGVNGKNGKNGKNGIGITNASVNESGELIISFSDNSSVNVGKVVGATGIAGNDGLSAYQIALVSGATTAANESEWIASLKGDKGDIGTNGKSAYEIAKSNGCNLSEIEWLDSLKGTNGKSAYETAKQAGLTTVESETEWIASLKGEKGDKGDKGDTGAQGEKGDTGAQGEKGDKGDTGAQGEKGDKGDTGAQGEKGDKGDTGAQGEKGDKGDTGANGKSAYELAIDNGIITKMVTETQWLNSLKGEKGDKGDTGLGIQNITLIDGKMTVTLTDSSTYVFENLNGKDGVSPQIRINAETNKWEISTDNGTTWTSTNVKATGAQGEKGDKGDTGAQGEKGDKGDTGAQGEKGDKGDTGADGITPIVQINSLTNEWEISVNNGLSFESTGVKATGEKGDKGDKGDTGDKGDDGVSVTGVSLSDENKLVITLSEGDPIILEQSLMGAQGEKGDKGDTGADGVSVTSVTLTDDFCLVFNYSDGTNSGKLGPIKGEKGDKGDTGAQGEKGEKGDKGDTGAIGVGITTVSVDENGNLYITYSNTATATLLGNVKGPKGDKGDKGDTGVNGKSAFELYQQAYPDYTGTYTEWLASLKGEKGDKGDAGRGIASMTFNEDDELIVTYTDGTTQNMGTIPFTSSILEYSLLPDDTYGVYAGSGAANLTVIDIPAIYNSKAVTQIMTNGFKGLSMLQQVNIPDSVTIIGQYAFSECTSLDNVVVPNSVTIIDDYAFYNCTSLENIDISDSVVMLDNYAFYNCKSLTSISLPNSLQTIGAYLFNGCTNLKTISLPDSLTRIKAYAFYGSSIEKINMSTTPDDWKVESPQTAFVSASINIDYKKSIDEYYIKENLQFKGSNEPIQGYKRVHWNWKYKLLISSASVGSMPEYTIDQYPALIANMLVSQTTLQLYSSGGYDFGNAGTIKANFYKSDWVKK